MQKNDLDSELTSLAFDFFYWFSRFEFALKNNGYLKSHNDGDDADPGWDAFVRKHESNYLLSNAAKSLLKSPPKRQIVKANGDLDWKDLGLEHCRSDLEKISLLIRRVRNNLFHGGKHGGDEWDDISRNFELLTISIEVLDQIAQHGGIENDYLRRY